MTHSVQTPNTDCTILYNLCLIAATYFVQFEVHFIDKTPLYVSNFIHSEAMLPFYFFLLIRCFFHLFSTSMQLHFHISTLFELSYSLPLLFHLFVTSIFFTTSFFFLLTLPPILSTSISLQLLYTNSLPHFFFTFLQLVFITLPSKLRIKYTSFLLLQSLHFHFTILHSLPDT